MLLPLLCALAVAASPPVPAGAYDGEIVEIDGLLYEVVGDRLVPVDEPAQPEGDAPPRVVDDDAISVTGSRLDRDPARAVVRTEAVSAREIVERGSTDLADVLDDQAGISIGSSLGVGEEVTMDGLDGRHVLILVDGRPVNGRVNNRVDVGRIPVSASAIERIEIVRGPMSALYGSEALGGVVNIVTKRPSGGASGEVDLSTRLVGGGVFWNTAALHGSGSTGPFALRLDLQTSSSPAIDRAGIVVAGFDTDGDGVDDTRRNLVVDGPDGRNDTPDRRSTQMLAEASVFITNDWLVRTQGVLDLAESSARVNAGIPVREGTQNMEGQLATTLEGDLLPGHQLVVDARVDRFFHRFEKNPDADALEPPAFCVDGDRPTFGVFDRACPAEPQPRTVATQDEARLEARYTGVLLEDVVAVDELAVVAGAQATRERTVRENGDGEDTIPGGGERATGALFGEVLYKPLDFLALLPGARFDVFAPGAGDDPVGFALGPKLSTRLELPLGFALRASYGQGFRVPSFQERFLRFDHSELGYVVEGNEALKPETSHGARAEAVWTSRRVEIGVEGFVNLVDNLITERAVGQTEEGALIYRYENASHATTAGVNARASLDAFLGLAFDVDAQWLPYAVDASLCPDENPWFCGDDEGAEPLLLRAPFELTTRLRYDVKGTGTSLFTYADFTERRFLRTEIDGARLYAPSALLVGVGLRQRLFDHAELTVSLDNVLDRYHPQFGPKPGRHATATVRAWF